MELQVLPQVDANANEIEHEQTPSVFIPFSRLVRTDKNVRDKGNTSPSFKANIERLACMIRAQGLLQPILVVEVTVEGEDEYYYGVIAGDRRYCAIELLISRGYFGKEYPVECKLKKEYLATEISLAENLHREELNMADEFSAYLKIASEGRSTAEIAIRYGIPKLQVERSLRLANAAPELFAMFRNDEITYEQLQALSLSTDHAKQLAVWNSLPEYERQPSAIRRMLTQEEADVLKDPVAIFVGLTAYEAAGGAVRRDLFSVDGNGGFMEDIPLLYRLATEKMEEKAVAIREEGWGWVDVMTSVSHSHWWGYGHVMASERPPTEEEQGQLDELEALAEMQLLKLEGGDEAEYEGGDEGDEEGNYGPVNRDYEEHEATKRKIESIRKSLLCYTPDDLSRAGATLFINSKGELAVKRGLVKRDETDADASTGMNVIAQPKKVKPEFAESLVTRLTSHKTAALQYEVMSKPDIALVAVLHAFVVDAFYRRPTCSVKIRTTNNRHVLFQQAPDLEDSIAWQGVESAVEMWKEKLPEDFSQLFYWLHALSQPEQLALLAVCSSLSIDATTSDVTRKLGCELADAVNLDMNQYWNPSDFSYLGHISKEKIIEAVANGAGVKATYGMEKMKKNELVKVAQQKLRGTGWLPAPIKP